MYTHIKYKKRHDITKYNYPDIIKIIYILSVVLN